MPDRQEMSAVARVTPAEGPSFGTGAFGGMDVQVVVFELFGVDAVFASMHPGEGDRQMGALFHHIAQRAGELNFARATRDGLHLDGQDGAAHAGPGKAVGDAHRIGAVVEVRLDAPGAHQGFQIRGSDGDLLLLAGGHLAGALAQHLGDGPFQAAHAGLLGVTVNKAVDGPRGQVDPALQAGLFQLLGQQVPAWQC